MKLNLTFLAVLLILTACTPPAEAPASDPVDQPAFPQGPYFGQTATDVPTMLAPDFISTNLNELNGMFGPDGKEFFFSLDAPRGDFRTIVYCEMDDSGTWSEVKIAPFSGQYSDVDPVFNPSGDRIYFCSDRPRGDGSDRKDVDIWQVNREGDSWGDPIHMGDKLNTSRNDWYCSSTSEGKLYYATWDAERNTDDIFYALAEDDYQPVNIGGGVNTGSAEFDPFIAPDESYLIFSSYRNSGYGNADLYISFNINGEWSEAVNLGETINSSGKDYCPWVSPDGQYLFFTSMRVENPFQEIPNITVEALRNKMQGIDNGLGNLYWVKTDFIDSLRPQS